MHFIKPDDCREKALKKHLALGNNIGHFQYRVQSLQGNTQNHVAYTMATIYPGDWKKSIPDRVEFSEKTVPTTEFSPWRGYPRYDPMTNSFIDR